MRTKKKIKTLLGHGKGLTPLVRKGEWQLAKEGKVQGGAMDLEKSSGRGRKMKRRGKQREIPKQLQLEVAKERAGGASVEHLAQKYGVTRGYVIEAMREVYQNSKTGREVLKHVILENGIASGMRARQTIKDLTPMQAIVATGVMSSKFVELEKHTQSSPAEVDFAELGKIGEDLKKIAADLGEFDGEDDGEEFIDV